MAYLHSQTWLYPSCANCTQKCDLCGKADDQASIIRCDSCGLGYHKNCLDPPLAHTPESDWHCLMCSGGGGNGTFEDGGIYSLKQFQEKANNFKENYFAPKRLFDPVLNNHRQESEDDVENEFWRLVESMSETVEVEYGADIHSTTHGSGFPTVERNPLDPYSFDPWNLNVLPFHGESLFRHIKTDISNMTVPWVNVGMCFSTFCWHNEDHYAYSANYQHFGATRTWYGIPGGDAEAFEEAMRESIPELFEAQPDLLFQLVTLVPPDQLHRVGVNVCAVDQRAGQLVITFPQAYHAGFNHGFNFTESVNFTPADWEPYGAASTERLQAFRKQPCFSHDELLLTAANRDSTISTARWLAPALERVCERELSERRAFANRHKIVNMHSSRLHEPNGDPPNGCQLEFAVTLADVPEDDYKCEYCKAYTYLSRFCCRQTRKTVCLAHVYSYNCCGKSAAERLLGSDHAVYYRISDEELEALTRKVRERALIPEMWAEKLDRALQDEPRPQLKTLHSLLSEGEKFPCNLPGLQDLATFVRHCDKWVEEANSYITRKQQTRRKNEKAGRKGNSKAGQLEERDRDVRSVENMYTLLAEIDKLSFNCPQMAALEEKVREVVTLRDDVSMVLSNPHLQTAENVDELLETGRSYNIDIPELEGLEGIRRKAKWEDDVLQYKNGRYMTLAECQELISAGEKQFRLPDDDENLLYLKDQCRLGEAWEAKAKELISAETVHYQQVEALSTQGSLIPVSAETHAAVDGILTKRREMEKRFKALYEKTKEPDFRKRPYYKDVRELVDSLEGMHSRPAGHVEVERELKRHENWIRKGKKLFGKANATLNILGAHIEYVEWKNLHCFDLEDRYRPPVEPSSRDNSPGDRAESRGRGACGKSRKRDVFCICRQSEHGWMIECEICHEWYAFPCVWTFCCFPSPSLSLSLPLPLKS